MPRSSKDKHREIHGSGGGRQTFTRVGETDYLCELGCSVLCNHHNGDCRAFHVGSAQAVDVFKRTSEDPDGKHTTKWVREPREVGARYICDCTVRDIDECVGGMDCRAELLPLKSGAQTPEDKYSKEWLRGACAKAPVGSRKPTIEAKHHTVHQVELSYVKVEEIVRHFLEQEFGCEFAMTVKLDAMNSFDGYMCVSVKGSDK